MPRNTQTVRVSQFLGFDDELPISIGEKAASRLENFYRVGNSLARRAGQQERRAEVVVTHAHHGAKGSHGYFFAALVVLRFD